MRLVQRFGFVVATGAIGCGSTEPPSINIGSPFPVDASVVRPPVQSGPPGLVTFNDAAASVNTNADYYVTLSMTPFTVPAGGEVFKCQDFANPFRGQAVDITQYDLVMSSGSHHMLLFYASGATDGPVTDCGGLQLSPFTFGSQSPMATEKYPDGVGAAIPAGMGGERESHDVRCAAGSGHTACGKPDFRSHFHIHSSDRAACYRERLLHGFAGHEFDLDGSPYA